MQPEFYKLIASRQETYWWNVSRREMSAELLRQKSLKAGARCLDLGCGTGQNLALLMSFGTTVGLDLSSVALEIAARKAPHAQLVQGNISQPLPFASETFDIVTIFSVLHHEWILDEIATLREVMRVLVPKGVLLITEPAFPILRRAIDDLGMTRRRYLLAEIVALLRDVGLKVEHASYFCSFGFPLLLVSKLIGRLSATRREASVDLKPPNPILNKILLAAARLERRLLLAGLRIPFGTTIVCVGRKD